MKAFLFTGLVLLCGILLGYGIFFLMSKKAGTDSLLLDTQGYRGSSSFQNTHLITQPTTPNTPTQFHTQSIKTRNSTPTVIE